MNRFGFLACILAIVLSVTTPAIAQRKGFNIYNAGGVPPSLKPSLVERLTLFAEFQRRGAWDKVAEMLGELSSGVSRSKYTVDEKQWVIERLQEKPMISFIPTAVSFSTANLNLPLRLRWWYVKGEAEFVHSRTERVVILAYRDRGEWYFQPMVVTSNGTIPLLKPASTKRPQGDTPVAASLIHKRFVLRALAFIRFSSSAITK